MRLNRYIKLSTALIGCLWFWSCSKQETPSKVILTFKTDWVGTNQSDDWVFISDLEGNLLDAKHFESGQTLYFTENPNQPLDKINVTVFRYEKDSPDRATFTSYLEVPVEQSWDYNKSNNSANNTLPVNSITVTATNYNETSDASHHFLASTQGYHSQLKNVLYQQGNNSTVTTNISFPNSPANVFLSTTRNSQPVFYELKNVVKGGSYTADIISDFKPFDHVTTSNIPNFPKGTQQYEAYIVGKITNQTPGVNYYLSYNYYDDPNVTNPASVLMGYNDGYESYETWAHHQNFSSRPYTESYYSKIGSPPSNQISLLFYTCTATNADYRNFEFQVSDSYQARLCAWYATQLSTTSNVTTTWYVYGPPKSSQKLPDIPQDLKTAYPAFNTINLSYIPGGIFWVFNDDYTYLDFLCQYTGVSNTKLSSSEFWYTSIFY